MKEKIKKEYILIFIVVVLIAYSFIRLNKKNNQDIVVEKESLEENEVIDDTLNKETDIDIIKEDYDIYIHISGQVSNPGIQMLKNGSRVIDAVEAAGGLTTEVDLDKINLSKILKDEDKIYIPKIGEVLENNDNTIYNEVDMNLDDKKIDINEATKEELITLPGVGEKTADKILEYRKEKHFDKIEDLMNVSGIGDKKFEAVSSLIIVR